MYLWHSVELSICVKLPSLTEISIRQENLWSKGLLIDVNGRQSGNGLVIKLDHINPGETLKLTVKTTRKEYHETVICGRFPSLSRKITQQAPLGVIMDIHYFYHSQLISHSNGPKHITLIPSTQLVKLVKWVKRQIDCRNWRKRVVTLAYSKKGCTPV